MKAVCQVEVDFDYDDEGNINVGATKYKIHSDDVVLKNPDGTYPVLPFYLVTLILTSGLVQNIHIMDQNGIRGSADHLRMIIRNLEQGFALPNVQVQIEGEIKK